MDKTQERILPLSKRGGCRYHGALKFIEMNCTVRKKVSRKEKPIHSEDRRWQQKQQRQGWQKTIANDRMSSPPGRLAKGSDQSVGYQVRVAQLPAGLHFRGRLLEPFLNTALS